MTRTQILLEKLAAGKVPKKDESKAKKPGKKKEPTLLDKRNLTVKALQAKYPETYKTKADATTARIASNPTWTKSYKKYITQSAPNLTTAVQANPLSNAAKDDVIAVHKLLNSPVFQDLPEDVRQQLLEDTWGGEGADLTLGGTSVQELMDAIRNQAGRDSGSMTGGQEAAQQMYSQQYSPAGTADPRFGEEAAEEIAKIKSDREKLNENEKERAYRYTNRAAGEFSQAFDNPADQKVYQDSVNNLRQAMRNLMPSENAPQDWDRFNTYDRVSGGGTKQASWGGQLADKAKAVAQASVAKKVGEAVKSRVEAAKQKLMGKFTQPAEVGGGVAPKQPLPGQE